MKMASGGKLLHEGRTEKLLSRILPEVSSSTEDENDRNPSPPPFKVPDGLRSLLNELSKEVLKSLILRITVELNIQIHLLQLQKLIIQTSIFAGSKFSTKRS